MRMIFPILMMVAIFGANIYVLYRIWQILPFGTFFKVIAVLLYLACFAGVFLGFGGGFEKMSLKTASVVYEVSDTWLIFFLYAFIGFIALDILKAVHLFPKALLKDSFWGSLLVFGSLAALLYMGNLHYKDKIKEEMTIKTGKTLDRPLRILFASDLHLGYHNRKDELSRWVDIMNSEKPDLILIGGDIIDISARPLVEGDYASELRRLEAPVYAVLGNHEYYSGDSAARKFYSDAGIHLLRDETVSLMGINVVGRDDRTNRSRKDLPSLMEEVDLSRFTILLDHQPSGLEEAQENKVDFQFSGHTHRGQVWPISWVTDMIFEDSWGPYQKGDTKYYVSSGLGIWGAKIRIGTRSEYLVLDVEGE